MISGTVAAIPAGSCWPRLLCPPLLGGLLTWSWQGALTAFFWAGLVRITWSTR